MKNGISRRIGSVSRSLLGRCFLFLVCLVCYYSDPLLAQSYSLERIGRPASTTYNNYVVDYSVLPLHCPYNYASISSLKDCLSRESYVPTGGDLHGYVKALEPDATDFPLYYFDASLPLNRATGVELVDSSVPSCAFDNVNSQAFGNCSIGYVDHLIKTVSSNDSGLRYCRIVSGVYPSGYSYAGRIFSQIGIVRYTPPSIENLFVLDSSSYNPISDSDYIPEISELPFISSIGQFANVIGTSGRTFVKQPIRYGLFVNNFSQNSDNYVSSNDCNYIKDTSSNYRLRYRIIKSDLPSDEPVQSTECTGVDGLPYLAVVPNVSPNLALQVADVVTSGAVDMRDASGSPLLDDSGNPKRCKFSSEDVHFVSYGLLDYVADPDFEGIAFDRENWIPYSEALSTASVLGYVDQGKPDAIRIDVVMSGGTPLTILDPTSAIPRNLALVPAGPVVDVTNQKSKGWKWASGVKFSRMKTWFRTKLSWASFALLTGSTLTIDLLSQESEVELLGPENGISDARDPSGFVEEGFPPFQESDPDFYDFLAGLDFEPVPEDPGVSPAPTLEDVPAPTVELPQGPVPDLSDAAVDAAIDEVVRSLGGPQEVAEGLQSGVLDSDELARAVLDMLEWLKLPKVGETSPDGLVETPERVELPAQVVERVAERVEEKTGANDVDLPDAGQCTPPAYRAQNAVVELAAKIGGPATSLIAPLMGFTSSSGVGDLCFELVAGERLRAVGIGVQDDLRLCLPRLLLQMMLWLGWLSTAFACIRIVFR